MSTERERFEAWASKDGYRIERGTGKFEHTWGSTACIWAAWQAASAPLQAQIEALEADAQRSLEERIAMALDQARLEAGIESLRGFVKAVMGDWPDVGGLDGFDLQRLGEKFGLLKKDVRTEPCGEWCQCAGDALPSEWATGVECFRLTELVKGAASAAQGG